MEPSDFCLEPFRSENLGIARAFGGRRSFWSGRTRLPFSRKYGQILVTLVEVADVARPRTIMSVADNERR